MPSRIQVRTLGFLVLVSLVAGIPARSEAPAVDPDSGVELLGNPAPPLLFDRWLGGPARSMESFRGKVVLIRFWTDECRFCRTTLPAIEALRERYAQDGLVVIGAFHPHTPRRVSDAHVRQWAKRLGYSGTVAVDASWRTINRWWLDGHPDRNWLSVSFLVDREGRVIWVHGGGEYFPSDDPLERRMDVAYRGLEAKVREALGLGNAAAYAPRDGR